MAEPTVDTPLHARGLHATGEIEPSIVLQVEGLTTEFATDAGIVHAVNSISYALKEGETLGVVGESGCGKTVHALSILRLVPPPAGRIVAGEVMYLGIDLLRLSEEEMRQMRGREIAMVFQDPMTSLNPVLTVGEQIMEPLVWHLDMNKRQARLRAAELLDLVGFPEAGRRLDSYPHEFSGGMRQRAMIAMALACDPKLLIADEPTTALDVTIQAQILDLVNRLRERLKMSMIWITHDLGVVAGLAQRVIVMYAGHIVEEARVQDLYADPRHPYTLGLLASLPRIDRSRPDQRLVPITGAPPDLLDLPPGCPFLPRCTHAADVCARDNPGLRVVSRGHRVACWVDVPHSGTQEAVA
ncbi:MAG: ABC transporter ATP-binding protein [Anaerolineales bacterium]|jgi:oligopeptide transport system ATP-binding protein|nr:ABC transporter ATP-binding protein [Anaerolineales bacterium]